MARQQSKDTSEKHQAILSRLLKDDDNKYCVDCDAKGPRWASWNLGIFVCIRCAGIHRNLGVHISKVKSINLDSWTPEQIASVEDMGNSRARAVYEANLPDNYKRPSSSDSAMEQFIRAKYEHKKYIAAEWVPSKPRAVPTNYFEKEKEPKKESKRTTKTVITIPGAAAGTTASAKVEKKAIVKKEEPVPSLMVDLSSPAKQVNGNAAANPQTSSSQLLADIFTSPAAPAAAAPPSGNADLFGMTANQSIAQSGGDDGSQDLFKMAEEKNQTAKDSIMALFGNTSNPQPNMMSNSFGMQGSYTQQPQQMGVAPGQQHMMYPNAGMMGGVSYPQAQAQNPGYSMATQQNNTMVSSQQGMMGNMQSQQGMMGNMQSQQGMMGNMQPQQSMMGNMQQPQQYGAYQNPQQLMYATQQLPNQMANLSFNQQPINQGVMSSGSSGTAWGSNSASNGQTLNLNLWN